MTVERCMSCGGRGVIDEAHEEPCRDCNARGVRDHDEDYLMVGDTDCPDCGREITTSPHICEAPVDEELLEALHRSTHLRQKNRRPDGR